MMECPSSDLIANGEQVFHNVIGAPDCMYADHQCACAAIKCAHDRF